MRIVILTNPPDLSAYIAEILQTWGMPLHQHIAPSEIGKLDPNETPVLICPVSDCPNAISSLLLDYTRRGGKLLSFLPSGILAEAAGLEDRGEKASPLRLRVTAKPVAGLAGELLPVLGRARTYHKYANDASTLAYLTKPYSFEDESVGVVARPLGYGRIVAFAFDLPHCVLVLRQGDPSHAEWSPSGIKPEAQHAKTTHMAAELGPGCDGWIPFADLLARWLVELVRQSIPAPVPLLSHLPGDAPGIVLYSGDEDVGDVAWNDEEFATVTAAGARMNLYIIPNNTHSTPSDVRRYQQHHDIGPHPNLRSLDNSPISERLAEYERQVRLFQDRFGIHGLTTRHHCLAWVGYTEIVELQERLGIRMDTNYLGGPAYFRHMETGPYFGFGAAMPMRFCRLDGRHLQVFQQHTHIEDDVWFGEHIPYSLKLLPEQYRVVFDRMIADATQRFHTPIGVNFHPGNWVRFSAQQGRDTLQLAARHNVPVWSFDQWCNFWLARDTWRFTAIQWNGGELTVHAEGQSPCDDLRLWMPTRHENKVLKTLRCDGNLIATETVSRFRESFALVAIPSGAKCVEILAEFQGVSHL